MPNSNDLICQEYGNTLQPGFFFCPYCGVELKGIVCPNCSYTNERNSKFCQECGTPLRNTEQRLRPQASNKQEQQKQEVITDEIPQPPAQGITIDFPFSSSQSFDFALAAAKKLPSFQQFGEGKKALYRINVLPHEIADVIELAEYMKGWRNRIIYVNGEKVTWDSVFSFMYCYQKRKSSFRPEVYCFGYENDWQLNVWGCINTRLTWLENSEWFKWGKWLNSKGDWQFDKERIKHELIRDLHHYRFCPALQPELLREVVSALPDIVNPHKNRNWKFVQAWTSDAQGITMRLKSRFGSFNEEVVVVGVAPNGPGALEEIAKRMKSYKLPMPQK